MKKTIARLISKISPSLFFRISYYHNRGKLLNLKNPQDLSAIWIKKLLNGEIKKNAWLADKYVVRKYVRERVGEHILPDLIGVWDNPLNISFSDLPEKFALKMNYGAGMNIICTDKNNFDKEDAIRKLNKWLSLSNYSFSESHYNLIQRKIICEEFIFGKNGMSPTDYKILCIKGEPFCILACTERASGNPKFTVYDTNWKWLPEYQKKCPEEQKQVDKPELLSEMLYIASKLSKGIDLVRVDLYQGKLKRSNKDCVIFGEMTLTPSGCLFHRWSQKALDDAAKFYYSR